MNYYARLENTKAYIEDRIGRDELFAQLAEEAAELAHAALKMRRVITGDNPTPIKKHEDSAALIEEIADVMLLIEMVDVCGESEVEAIKNEKLMRWRERLEEMQ